MTFNDAYKEWRNRARKYTQESIIETAINFLNQPTSDNLEEVCRIPWQTLLLIKWICQDKMMERSAGRCISSNEYYYLQNELWKFPEKIGLDIRETLPGCLFVSQLLRAQLDFQRPLSKSFVREAALLEKQPETSHLHKLFENKTGIRVQHFLDLSCITYDAISQGKRSIGFDLFSQLKPIYSAQVIDKFISCISRTPSELATFFQSLPKANPKLASELYEFPILKRYPFLRIGNSIIVWHPIVFYRGIEDFIHTVLSEEGQQYIDRFSKIFEKHIIDEARKLPYMFFGEDELKRYVAQETQVPDGLISLPDCNIFIESKAGLFGESVMTVGNSEIFAHKTRALQKAVAQGWSVSAALRNEKRAPKAILNAPRDYLLIITNKELNASNGTKLAEMYPQDTLAYPDSNSKELLPLDNIYVLSINDFERLVRHVCRNDLDLSLFLGDCVEIDSHPSTSLFSFEQHLERGNIPSVYSDLVSDAFDAAAKRLSNALNMSD